MRDCAVSLYPIARCYLSGPHKCPGPNRDGRMKFMNIALGPVPVLSTAAMRFILLYSEIADFHCWTVTNLHISISKS